MATVSENEDFRADTICQRVTFEKGKLERRPKGVRANSSFDDGVPGRARIGPDKDRIGSNGHRWSTANDIGRSMTMDTEGEHKNGTDVSP
jgi:hypothetical protein